MFGVVKVPLTTFSEVQLSEVGLYSYSKFDTSLVQDRLAEFVVMSETASPSTVLQYSPSGSKWKIMFGR